MKSLLCLTLFVISITLHAEDCAIAYKSAGTYGDRLEASVLKEKDIIQELSISLKKKGYHLSDHAKKHISVFAAYVDYEGRPLIYESYFNIQLQLEDRLIDKEGQGSSIIQKRADQKAFSNALQKVVSELNLCKS